MSAVEEAPLLLDRQEKDRSDDKQHSFFAVFVAVRSIAQEGILPRHSIVLGDPPDTINLRGEQPALQLAFIPL